MEYPVEGINDASSEASIIDKLSGFGIEISGQSSSGSGNVTINLWGTGNPYREFLYADDAGKVD